MTAILQVIVTSALTVVVGIALLVAGEVIKHTFIEPINEQKQLLADISEALVFYSHQCTKPVSPVGAFLSPDPRNPFKPTPEEVLGDEASGTIRKLAARLRAKTQGISWYGLWRLLHIAPDRQKVMDTSFMMLDLADSTPPFSVEIAQANYAQLVLIDGMLSTIYHTKEIPYPYLLNTTRKPVPMEQPPKVEQSEPQP